MLHWFPYNAITLLAYRPYAAALPVADSPIHRIYWTHSCSHRNSNQLALNVYSSCDEIEKSWTLGSSYWEKSGCISINLVCFCRTPVHVLYRYSNTFWSNSSSYRAPESTQVLSTLASS